MRDQYAVIFDMDGVLVDSYRPHLESWQETARQYGVEMTKADFDRTFGRTARELIQMLWPGKFSEQQVGALDRDKEVAYRRLIEKEIPAMEGVKELIESLHAGGFHMAIGSSGPRENVELVHRVLPGAGHISHTVHGLEVKQGKPDPEIFLLAAKKLGVQPERCAVIEDSLPGLEAAKRAGMARIGITGTMTREQLDGHANVVVTSLRELTPAKVREVILGHGLQCCLNEPQP